MRLRVTWVTNIPSPYRNHRYRRMRELLPPMGIDFEVYYMTWSETGRQWQFTDADLDHPHHVFRSLHVRALGEFAHISPGLLAKLRSERRDVVVVGGWGYPTALLAPFAVSGRPVRVLECESHLESTRRRAGLARRVKTAIVGRYDAYLVPGARARELVEGLAPSARGRPFGEFPNLVDDAVFSRGVARLRQDREAIRVELGVDPARQLWFCPARLETFKGLHTFLPLLVGVEGIELLVAGDGACAAPFRRPSNGTGCPSASTRPPTSSCCRAWPTPPPYPRSRPARRSFRSWCPEGSGTSPRSSTRARTGGFTTPTGPRPSGR